MGGLRVIAGWELFAKSRSPTGMIMKINMTTQKWFGVGIGVVILIAAAYFIEKIPNNSGSLQVQENLMQLQDTCHKWGNTILKNNRFRSNPQVFTHYNTVLGKCFVEVTSGDYFSAGGYVLDDNVFDAEKGTLILDREDSALNGSSSFSQTAFDRRPVNGDTSQIVITSDQFRELRDQYMNN